MRIHSFDPIAVHKKSGLSSLYPITAQFNRDDNQSNSTPQQSEHKKGLRLNPI